MKIKKACYKINATIMLLHKIVVLLISIACILPLEAKENTGMEIAEIQYNISTQKIKDIKECAEKSLSKCRIEMGIHNIYYNALTKDEHGKENYVEARKWLEPMSGQSPIARYLIGVINIREGRIEEAKSLISSSAIENFYPALISLINEESSVYRGKPYESIKNDILRWEYRAYAITHDATIAYNINIYFMSLPQKDCLSAMQWLTKATTKHNADPGAQNYLGQLYETGNCVPQDYVMAYMMYDLSGRDGIEQKHELAKKMSQEQVNEGIQRSHQWQDNNQSYRLGYGDWGGNEIHWNVHEY